MTIEQIVMSQSYYEHLSLYVSPQSTLAALLSCGGVIESALAVARGQLDKTFAIVRPPGHHAEPEEHMGFCFFNNVAVATRVVQQLTPMKRILILDWSVDLVTCVTEANTSFSMLIGMCIMVSVSDPGSCRCFTTYVKGNGTQRAFLDDPSVLYISLHRYDGGDFYPCGPFGGMDSCGEGEGLGK